MTAYYNENDPFAAQWLRNLIAVGHIAPGDVDERSIVDVRPGDLDGYVQCHFFAGIGGWSYAARLAGWSDDRPLWTGSCPCQGESVAGKQLGAADPRHLWPAWFPLIRARRPAVVMGEQVARAAGTHWLDGVCADMEGIGYAVRPAIVPACAVDAPHRRDRLWFVADTAGERRDWIGASSGMPRRHVAQDDGCRALAYPHDAERRAEEPRRHVADGSPAGRIEGDGDASERGAIPLGHPGSAGLAIGSRAADERVALWRQKSPTSQAGDRSPWGAATWLLGADGKARRVEPSIRLLAHGVPARVGRLRAYGNAIVPQVAAEVIGAYLDARLFP